MQHPGWEDRRPEYREFCKNNANRTFTVEDDKYHKGLVCLADIRKSERGLKASLILELLSPIIIEESKRTSSLRRSLHMLAWRLRP